MAIAEQAPYSQILLNSSKKSDPFVNTIQNGIENKFIAITFLLDPNYKNFLKNFQNNAPQKVTNFDDLIKELDQKQKCSKKGFFKNTPLTEYIYQQALEKVF